MKYKYAIPDTMVPRADELTLRDAIDVVIASRDIGTNRLTCKRMCEIMVKGWAGRHLTYNGLMSRDIHSIQTYWLLFLESMSQIGLEQEAAQVEVDASPTGKPGEASIKLSGHTFIIPNLKSEPVMVMIGLDNALESMGDMHPIEAMPMVLACVIREEGEPYRAATIAPRAEILKDLKLSTACRLTAFFFANCESFRESLSHHFPDLARWTPLLSELEQLSSVSAGDALRFLCGSQNSKGSSTHSLE